MKNNNSFEKIFATIVMVLVVLIFSFSCITCFDCSGSSGKENEKCAICGRIVRSDGVGNMCGRCINKAFGN